MSKLLIGLTAAVSVAFSFAAFTPESANAQSVFEACSNEVTNNCSAVKPGDGRLYACLYANEEKLSQSCDDAAEDVLDQLDIFFELIRYVKQECAADIEASCSSVEIGGGRIYSCLKAQSSSLSEECGKAMSNITMSEK